MMSQSQLLAHRWRGRQHGQKRQGPGVLAPRNWHHGRHHDPSQLWAADRTLATGERTVAIVPALADLRPPASFQRLVDGDLDDRISRQERLDHQKQQTPTGGKRGPTRPIEDLMKRTPVRIAAVSAQLQRGADRATVMCEQGSGE
ncbi:MAG TPA: hypothetical protein VFV38_19935 [Ktedonobacteraceae bacterium]|nr:hypothetical protein [Ktedonobacteraceae bacterium]